MHKPCAGVFRADLVLVGKEPGDPAVAKHALAGLLREEGCEVFEAPSWFVACCGGASVKGYAVYSKPGLLPMVRVQVEGDCREGLGLVRAIAEGASRAGHAALLKGQEGLLEGPDRLL